jgi:hypothetical protein
VSVRLAGPRGAITEHLVAADHGGFVFVLPADGVDANSLHPRVTFTH